MELVFLADRPEAASTLARWYFDEWGHLAENNSVEKVLGKVAATINRDKAPLSILATDGNQIAGGAQLKMREMERYPDYEFWPGNVFVQAEYRGRGVAASMAKEIARLAKSFGIPALYLQTQRLDGGVYARLGWKPVEPVNYRGVEVLVMKRTLGA
ncbi:MAG: GNAT family N-acetyltransferase [Gammaproteobacteria bacterium]|nr:GNAT family N-acetyltransferase [Gammaproteobacteria bacterium]